ncbi:MAG: transglutaminaseTgpA domain-containing protein [Burkholderiaceae bacterium]
MSTSTRFSLQAAERPAWAGLASLPRDARDTLFLLVVIAWVLLPQVSRLPLWCSALAAGVLIWRGMLALRAKPLPSQWWVLGLLGLAVAGTAMSHQTLLGRDAGVTLIAVLLTLKTLELRAKRDAFVIFFLSFFTLLTNFFYSQSLLTAASMLLALLGLLTALVNAHMPVGRPPLLQAMKTAGYMALLGAPIMALLFVLFPRLAPLWGIPSDGLSGRSGLSGTMQVGTIASLALDESIVMRIKFEAAVPLPSELYFRGPVFSNFDGREWRPQPSRLDNDFSPRLQAPANLQVSGAPVRYEITLEPTNRPWVFVLEAAPDRPQASAGLGGAALLLSSDLQWLASRPLTDITRYQAQSYPQFRHGPQRRVTALQDELELPPGFNPRTLALASEIRRDPRYAQAGGLALAQAALERLRTQGYSYTLEPGVYGQHSADEFWFDRKEGFCEHIASAFVILMRALDVPARVVTGYQGGAINPIDGFWTLRQSDAHAWTEIWEAQRGWVRVDPTSAVAPGRVGAGQRLRAPQGLVAQAFGTVSPGLSVSLRNAWEAINNRWNQWVLNYTQSKQLDLLKNLGFQSPSWHDLGYVLSGLVVLASLVGALWTLRLRSQHDPWLRTLKKARKRLRRAGLSVPEHSSPRQLAMQLAAQGNPAWSAPLQDWLLRLEALRYAPPQMAQGSRPTLAALQRELRQFSWS